MQREKEGTKKYGTNNYGAKNRPEIRHRSSSQTSLYKFVRQRESILRPSHRNYGR